MLSDWLRRVSKGFLDPIAQALIRLGITANWITAIGMLLNLVVGVLLALHHPLAGGILLIFAAGLDAFDGAVARNAGKATRFGAFFDSTLDRISEAAIFGGLLWHYMSVCQPINAMLCFAVLAGSVMVSYTRARAEGLGIDCKVGWFTRVERSVLTIAALVFFGLMPYMLWLLAAGTWFTTGQRVWHVFKTVRDQPL